MATKTTFQKIYFYVSLIIVLILFVLIFCLSHQSGEESTMTSGWFTTLLNFIFPFELTESFVRTMAHFSEFACLSFFMNNLFVAYKEKLFRKLIQTRLLKPVNTSYIRLLGRCNTRRKSCKRYARLRYRPALR